MPALEPVPLSALQHFAYCPRQCALIHVERAWDENVFTERGRRAHERAHEAGGELLFGVRLERSLHLWNTRLGLVGRADIVEFAADGTPYPVEYKAGSRKARLANDLQLCAQGLCLEEMLGRAVTRGAVYHHASRRRREVDFTRELRAAVEDATRSVRELLASETLPPPVADARCPDCSLLDVCLPDTVAAFERLARHVDPFALEPGALGSAEP